MILQIQNHLRTLIVGVRFGQIPNEPSDVTVLNLVDTGRRLYFDDGDTFVVSLHSFIRCESFEDLHVVNGAFLNSMHEMFDVMLDGYKIVDTKHLPTYVSAERDDKDRYFIQNTHELIVIRS